MKLNEALAKLNAEGLRAKISRPGGPTVRKAKNPEEKARHAYLTEAGDMFDASAADHAATDWDVLTETARSESERPDEQTTKREKPARPSPFDARSEPNEPPPPPPPDAPTREATSGRSSHPKRNE